MYIGNYNGNYNYIRFNESSMDVACAIVKVKT